MVFIAKMWLFYFMKFRKEGRRAIKGENIIGPTDILSDSLSLFPKKKEEEPGFPSDFSLDFAEFSQKKVNLAVT